MGNRYSFESLNPERYQEVRLSSTSMFWQCETVRFPFKHKPSDILEDALWQQFGSEIDELLPLIDRFLGLISLLMPVMMLAIWFLAVMVSGETGENGGIYLFAGFIAVAIFFVVSLIVIHNRNDLVDKQIHKICANYMRRFQEYGLAPEYRTKWTGVCKPKGARPLRMIVFIPTGNVSA